MLPYSSHVPSLSSSTRPPFAACAALLILFTAALGCSDDEPAPVPPAKVWSCVIPDGEEPDFTKEIGCEADFVVLGPRPLDASIPGARSAKTVVDRADELALYFQNTHEFPIHYNFAKKHLSGDGLPPVGDISTFNQIEYYSPSRRFILGAVTLYEEPGVWVYEIAPYDSASPEMVADAFARIRDATFFGTQLYFHPTSKNVETMAADLPAWVPIITSDELFAGMTYQPLNLGEALGQLRFYTAEDLDNEEIYVGPRDIAVLDRVPNDISVVAGIITAEMQTPLSHINVLSQNRGTPNMALRGAFEDEALRSLENKWVRQVVDAFAYTVEEVTKEEADAWWEDHKPPPVEIPAMDLTVTDLRDIELVTLDDIPAFGGKASNYGVMSLIDSELVPHPKAFAIPIYYYKQFEQQNGFDQQLAALQADEQFVNNPAVRDAALRQLREAMWMAPVDEEFKNLLYAKLQTDYPGVRMRFRSSTNAEDLAGFTGAGLYASHSGDFDDPDRPILTAVRKTWASLWNFRAYEERTYRGIPHDGVGMAVLCHHSFPDEEANGVALTGNMFDETQPGFYINVQAGEESVVKPEPGITVDSFLYYYYYPGQPRTFFSHSNLIPEGENVLTAKQTYALGKALDAIHKHFASTYQSAGHFYAMDVEFKFDDLGSGGEPSLWVKQARPHAGWSGGE